MTRGRRDRLELLLDGHTVEVGVTDGFQVGNGIETLDSPEAASERYEQIKLIASIEYGLTLFIEHEIDGTE